MPPSLTPIPHQESFTQSIVPNPPMLVQGDLNGRGMRRAIRTVHSLIGSNPPSHHLISMKFSSQMEIQPGRCDEMEADELCVHAHDTGSNVDPHRNIYFMSGGVYVFSIDVILRDGLNIAEVCI